MTAALGVICQDGIVMGSDGASSAVRTSGKIRYERAKQKIWIHEIDTLCCVMGVTAGKAASGQFVKYAIKRYIEIKKERLPKIDEYDLMFETRKWLLDELQKVPSALPSSFSVLLSFAVNNESPKFMLRLQGSELAPMLIDQDLNYHSIGSGSTIINPFFEFLKEVFWNDTLPTVAEAQIGVVWALQHTIATSSAGVSAPMSIGIMQGVNASLITPKEMAQEIEEFIVDMKQNLQQYMQTRGQRNIKPKDGLGPPNFKMNTS